MLARADLDIFFSLLAEWGNQDPRTKLLLQLLSLALRGGEFNNGCFFYQGLLHTMHNGQLLSAVICTEDSPIGSAVLSEMASWESRKRNVTISEEFLTQQNNLTLRWIELLRSTCPQASAVALIKTGDGGHFDWDEVYWTHDDELLTLQLWEIGE